ncbi:hypothetical protein OIU84_023251 [Salix udensis]|uniref:Uncharacterized protein n=1 Tax=Salix udensis TaxID=889485 RepID=A0AAD6PFL8_9ROSI|nr:hypothetical protein OIU84_023251 [Salix udensis]
MSVHEGLGTSKLFVRKVRGKEMELSSSHEGGIPIPLNSTFGGAHGHGHLILHHDHPALPHNHNIISSAAPQTPPSPTMAALP